MAASILDRQFSQHFAAMSPSAVVSAVGRAFQSADHIKPDGKHTISDRDLRDLQVAHAGLSAQVARGAEQRQGQAQQGPSLARRAATFMAGSVIAGGIMSAVGLPPVLGVVADVVRAPSVFGGHRSPAAQPASPHRNPSHGYFHTASQKGADHIGSYHSFADEADQARGVSAPVVGSARPSGKALGLHSVLQQKFAQVNFTDAQHAANMKHLAQVEKKITGVQALMSGEKLMDAAQPGVLPDSTWHNMNGGQRQAIIAQNGFMTLAQTGSVSPGAMTRFTVGSYEMRPPQVAAMSFGPSFVG